MNWSIDHGDAIIAAFDEAIVDVWGPRMARLMTGSMMRRDMPVADNWRELGATVELCAGVFKEVMEFRKGRGDAPPGTLSYCDQPIKKAICAAEQAKRVELSPEDSRWKFRYTQWVERKAWIEESWGPRPNSPLCRVPPYIKALVSQSTIGE